MILAAVLTACSPAPQRVIHPKPDPTKEAWYGENISQLAAMSSEAETLLHHNAPDRAAAVITQSQPMIQRLLSVPRPTLAAMEAVSDSDQLYGQMLIGNRHYVWARVFFQKNVTRWTLWKPQTADTVRRLKIAHAGIAECERHIDE
jgi:hypothetical protein